MAGLGRKEWSPGDTLNAADVNGYLMDQSVMVFAGTAARASAIPSPSAGMVAYSTATNLEYYDGSNWESVAVPTGLALVQAETTFTGQTSFNVPNIFTAAYTNYLINFRFFTVTSSGGLNVQLSVGGVAAATNYNNMRIIAFGASSLISTRSTAQTSFPVVSTAGSSTGIYQWAQLQLSGPQLAEATLMSVTGALQDGAAYITPDAEIFNGNHSTATAYDGMTIIAAAGTITGAYTVYGYGKS